MSLVDAHIEFDVRYVWLNQNCENVFKYFTEGAVFLGVNAVQVAEAFWNDIKTDFRAMVTDNSASCQINSVVCRNLVSGGELGEYAIPVGERFGTRSAAGIGDPVTGTLAVGFRQTVGNTSTRPGQKRFPFLHETDISGNDLTATILGLVETFAAHIDSPLTLGSPVAAGVLQPVVGGTVVGGYPTVYQDVLGHVLNPYITSQVSRKKGHGS